MNDSIKSVLILEDKNDLRTWINELISDSFTTASVHNATTIAEATALVNEHEFSLALLDLGLPDGTGVTIIEQLAKEQPDCLSVVMTIFDDSENLFGALKAGAFGYLLKDEDEDELLDALNGIIEGKPPISARMALRMMEYFREPKHKGPELTNRETEVLSIISKGYSVKKTSELLEISRYTVAEHLKNIYKKLNISSRSEATLKAIELGLLDQGSY